MPRFLQLSTLFCLLLGLPAHAVPITLDYGIPHPVGDNRPGSSSLSPNQNIVVQLNHAVGFNFHTPATSWTIPVTPANVGTTYTLNAANAASVGFDWALLQVAGLNLDSYLYSTPEHWRFAFQTPGIFGSIIGGYEASPFGLAGMRPVFSNIDRIELKLEEFYISPLGSVLRIHPKVIGDGILVPPGGVPEPASWLMLLIGLHVSGCGLPWRSRTEPRRQGTDRQSAA